MSGNRRKTTEDPTPVVDEVEELLNATQDELLLDLSVGSHISKVAPSYIDSDLNRRFQALKKPSSAPASSSSKPVFTSSPTTQKTPVNDGAAAADLLARYAALKGSRNEELGQQIRDDQVEGDSNEEDEVEKIIRWAKDAARLDPSSPTDSDDSENFKPSDVEDDSEEEALQETKPPKKKKQGVKRGLLGFRR